MDPEEGGGWMLKKISRSIVNQLKDTTHAFFKKNVDLDMIKNVVFLILFVC